MLKIVFATGILFCTGSGIAAYGHLNPGTPVAGIPQAAMAYMAEAPSRLKLFFSSDEPTATRPRIAQLPQSSGVRNRGNTSLAERKMRATASAMVDAVPTARAKRDKDRDASQNRRWSLFSRKAPDVDSQVGRLDAVQARARDHAEETAKKKRWKAFAESW